MGSNYDATEFVDTDFEAHKSPFAAPGGGRAPTREEVDSKVSDARQKLAELRRAQEELERERASLEELRRRQNEFHTGREEMIQNLTRGLGLLEQAEFAARRDAEQMAKTIAEFREALVNIQAIHEENWSKENFNVELTRALTAIENARMEWNSARLKLDVLNGPAAQQPVRQTNDVSPAPARTFGESFKAGLAWSLPLAVVLLLGFAAVVVALLSR